MFSVGMNMYVLMKNRSNGALSEHDALAFQHGVNLVPNGVDEL